MCEGWDSMYRYGLSGRIKVCKHRQSFLCLSNVLLTVINKTGIVRLQRALNLIFMRILSGNYRWNLSYAVSTTDALIRFWMDISSVRTHKYRHTTHLAPNLGCPLCQPHKMTFIYFPSALSLQTSDVDSCLPIIQITNLSLLSQPFSMTHPTLLA